MKTRLAALMAEPSPTTPAQFSAFVARELQKYKGVVATTEAKAD